MFTTVTLNRSPNQAGLPGLGQLQRPRKWKVAQVNIINGRLIVEALSIRMAAHSAAQCIALIQHERFEELNEYALLLKVT